MVTVSPQYSYIHAGRSSGKTAPYENVRVSCDKKLPIPMRERKVYAWEYN